MAYRGKTTERQPTDDIKRVNRQFATKRPKHPRTRVPSLRHALDTANAGRRKRGRPTALEKALRR